MSSSATPSRPAPLDNHPKYEKVKDLNSGTFGFVQLCKDKTTNELVAIKFIERGDKDFWPLRGFATRDGTGGRTRNSGVYLYSSEARGGGDPATLVSVLTLCLFCCQGTPLSSLSQVTKYVEREIVNHRTLMHPHIVQFKEVRERCCFDEWEGVQAGGDGCLKVHQACVHALPVRRCSSHPCTSPSPWNLHPGGTCLSTW
eukprot:1161634-Pelagomonas_calceolata.AAC.3